MTPFKLGNVKTSTRRAIAESGQNPLALSSMAAPTEEE
jgi:hypothetical protein